jgi:putative iron-dependent peroxidase
MTGICHDYRAGGLVMRYLPGSYVNGRRGMTEVQSGILPEGSQFAIYIEARVKGDLALLRQGCRAFCQIVDEMQQRFADAHLVTVLAFGHPIWQQLNSDSAPELKPFSALGNGLAPATQRDVLIHIQSARHDVNFACAQQLLAALQVCIHVEEETHGFRTLECRDLSGFVDGTENPHGEQDRSQVALIAEGNDAGGSYVMTQRWQHNLEQWQRLSLEQQQQTIGRTKQSNEEIPPDQRPVTAHLSRVDLKEQGKGLKIVRQSLPYGTVSGEHGLYFITYCARLYNIEQQLLSMFGERDGKHDALLRFTRPVSGSYFFAPSLTQLRAL